MVRVPMVIYEVTLTLDRSIEKDFAAWLGPHIREVLALPGFVGAHWFDAESEDDQVQWCVQYALESREALQSYLEEHAPRVREDGIKRFGNTFSASRRFLRSVERFGVAP